MSEGKQPWMDDYTVRGVTRPERPRSELGVGISEVFYGENGRELAFLRNAAMLIEELGYDSLWFSEHVVFFDSYASKYPYGQVGAAEVFRQRKEQDNPGLRGLFDGPIASVAAAAVTSRIRFGTYVNILPQRNPVVFAREIATVDHLTGGRFDFGVGIGWSREEYEACQTSFERRGARMDDYIRAMKNLWTAEVSSYQGEFVSFEPLLAYPKPLQQPHTPVLVGGQSIPGIRRAAELGDGLILYNLDIADVEKCLEVYEDELAKYGKRLDEAKIVVGRRNEQRSDDAWTADRRFIDQCRSLGAVTDVVCSPRFANDGWDANMRAYAEVVLG